MADDRPLQIVHGLPVAESLEGEQLETAADAFVKRLQDYGLGGMVCNMPFRDYMQVERDWRVLIAAIESCRSRGLVVWLYDEQGYPSGAAGGLVLKENPALEALELAYDASQPEPFVVRPSYEFTHANNNYYASRRYVNLLDAEATDCFIHHTHDAYWARLHPLFGSTIQAMFTDEPSLLAVSLGQIPENVRQRVPVRDAPDPSLQPLPAVPWCRDLPQRYRERFGEDILAARESLFEGHSPGDRRVRQQFWMLVSDLISDRYFGKLQVWCATHKVASSGHTLVEESLINQVAAEGNGLQVLSRLQIPGLDMLTSDPEAAIHSGWLTAGLPSSAAVLSGGRRVMTEISDFHQKMGGTGPASLAAMQAAAAWQAAWGVTDFTLYYSMQDRPQEEYHAYGEFVGRLNSILKPAQQRPLVLLYYPIRDLWSEYIPVAEQLTLASQSERAQRIVSSFMRLGQTLQRNQIPFALVDHNYLAAAQFDQDGAIQIGDRSFRCLLLPEGAELPDNVATLMRQAPKLRVMSDRREEPLLDVARIRSAISPAYSLNPLSARIALGQFQRDGRDMLLLVNVGTQPYDGVLVGEKPKSWIQLDPHSGKMALLPSNCAEKLR